MSLTPTLAKFRECHKIKRKRQSHANASSNTKSINIKYQPELFTRFIKIKLVLSN